MLKETKEQGELQQIVDENGEVFQLLKKVGQGGMGVVYQAVQQNLDRVVAIKMLHSHVYQSSHGLERLTKEAKATAKLQHPNIVRIYSMTMTSERKPFLVLEFVEGKTLNALVAAKGGKLTPQECVNIFRQVLEALGCAHKEGFIHRDLKPPNIIVNDDMRVKLMDFGLVKAVDEQATTKSTAEKDQGVTTSGQLLGSPGYMSPEQCRGETLDCRSDIYSLGCVIYRALTGEEVFDGLNTMEVMFKHIHERPQMPATMDRRFHYTVARALEKDPVDRFQTCDEFLSDLEDCLNKTLVMPALTKAQIAQYAKPKNVAKGKTHAPVLATILISLLGVGFFAFSWLTNRQPVDRLMKLESAAALFSEIEKRPWIDQETREKERGEAARQYESALAELQQPPSNAATAAYSVRDLAIRIKDTKPDQAARLIKTSLEMSKQIWQESSEQYTSNLLELGAIYDLLSDRLAAQDMFETSLKLRKGMHSPLLSGDAYSAMSASELLWEDYGKARRTALLAENEYAKAPSDVNRLTIAKWRRIKAEVGLYHFPVAFQHSQKLLAEFEKSLPDIRDATPPQRALLLKVCILNMQTAAYNSKVDEQQVLYKKALELSDTLPGKKPRLSVELEQTRLVPVMTSRTKDAIPVLKKALEDAKANDLISTARFVDAMEDLAHMTDGGTFADAEQARLYNQAASQLRRDFPKEY